MDLDDEERSPPESEIVRHNSLYFEDGDLVIAAPSEETSEDFTYDSVSEGGDPVVVFRVHGALLKFHSCVFRDMMCMPAGGGGPETYDGVPMVRLPDRADDIARFLRALYNPGVPLFRSSEPNTFGDAALTMMKLGDKYQVDSICQAILLQVGDSWPKRLDDFMCLVQNRTWWDKRRRNIEKHISESYPEPASAIRLAMDNNIPSILPAAFYVLAISDPDERWPTNGDFSKINKNRRIEVLPTNSDVLSDHDRLRLYRGRDRLSAKFQSLREVFSREIPQPYLDAPYCVANWDLDPTSPTFNGSDDHWVNEGLQRKWGTPCSYALSKFVDSYMDDLMKTPSNIRRSDPFRTLIRLQHECSKAPLCENCDVAAKTWTFEQIKKLWDELPAIFSLKPVEEVQFRVDT